MLGIIVSTIFIALVINLFLKKFDLPTIIGYIITGTIITYSFGLHSATSDHELKEIAEFGIVFLMFTIGLEFSIEHLKKMKKEVFITGTLQILVTILFVFVICKYFLDMSVQTALIIGSALALSSTAIVLKTFNETKEIKKSYGRRVLGILIMQDIAVIPILLMVSFFAMSDSGNISFVIFNTLIGAFLLLSLLFIVGRYLLEPFLEIVTNTKSDELFVVTVLLIAMGSSYLAYYFGFSYSLGAFIAGMLLSETKFKHQVEADLIPFRNILLGVFFVTVGMQINLKVIQDYILIIAVLLPLLMGIKFLIIYFLVRLDANKRVSFKTALSLIQIGEFSLAIIELSRSHSLINQTHSQILIVTIVLSMILTPLILKNLSKVANLLVPEDILVGNSDIHNPINTNIENHVVVLGYSAFGKAIVNELRLLEQKYVILEHNLQFFQEGYNKGEPIHFGNAAQKHILSSLNIEEAAAVIVAVHNPEALHLICEAVKELSLNTKTIVTISSESDIEFIKDLDLEHIVVETKHVAKAVVDEVLYCRLDE